MKRRIGYILFVLILINGFSVFSQGYNIKTTIEGIKDTSIILGYYFNKQIFVKDTVETNADSKAVFKGDEPLNGGIYIIYLPDKSFFDVLISDDQDFSIETKDGDLVNSQKITGATESEAFLEYQQFLKKKQNEAKELQKELQKYKKGTKEYDKVLNKLKNIKSEVDKKMDEIIAAHPDTFLAHFLQSTKEIEIPDFNISDTVANKDSVLKIKQYQYYVDHYFDNINLNDERLLRTPVFTDKLERYFTKILVQQPDTLINHADEIINSTSDPKMKKYLIQYLFNMATESKIMGMDKMVVYMAEKYYLSGMADWADSTFLTELRERVAKMKPNLIGNTAPDLKLVSPEGQYYRLSEVRAPITILVFWEPNCGHCKKEIPKLKELVWDKYNKDGVKIFAVYTQVDTKPWNEFIEKHDLYEWINVYDPYNQSGFRFLYDIYSTPTIYVLDKNKKIIGKRIGVEQLPGFIDYQLKKND
ncbi:MAG: redoxin domain-containing protein [Chlorobi bacterium]|nr:redoxin domain-containing protein [Chlorobiota bacterium]